MKSVLISVQPKWCEKIAHIIGKNGTKPIYEKSVEIRKTRPKIDTPFKVYIYCTKDKHGWFDFLKKARLDGKVIGEFVCNRIDKISKRGINSNYDYCYLSLNTFGNDDIEIEITDIKKSCIHKTELNSYGRNVHCLYAWHISDLVIYDKPKELSEFYVLDEKAIKECKHRERVYVNPDSVNGAWLKGSYICTKGEEDWCSKCKTKPLKRPPQSWCYVEGVEGK